MKSTQRSAFLWEVSELDLARPLTDADAGAVQALLHRGGAVLFRDQDIADRHQIALARRLGVLSGHNAEDRAGFDRRDADAPLQRLSNTEGVGRFSQLIWHSDNQFTPYPIRYLMLYALDVSTDGQPLIGGETMLASAADAIDRLPADLRAELETRLCRIDAQERGHFDRPCIAEHPVNGRRYLAISQMTTAILDVSEARSDEIIAAVQAVLYDPAHVHAHRWREGDLLVWDNLLLQHSRAFFDNAQTRVLRRTAVADEREPTALAV